VDNLINEHNSRWNQEWSNNWPKRGAYEKQLQGAKTTINDSGKFNFQK